MNPSFILILKSEKCRYKQNRQLSFLVKGDTKIVNLKVKVKAQEKSNSCSQNLNPQKIIQWTTSKIDKFRTRNYSDTLTWPRFA